MRDRVKVVDASALAAVLFGEPRAEEIAEHLAGSQLTAPSLLSYEMCSVCLNKIKRYPKQRAALLEALSLLDCLELKEVDVPRREMVALAQREKLTVYDASYLWLARALKAELVTLDAGLLRTTTRPKRRRPRR